MLLPAAPGARGAAVARDFVDSLTLGAGQFRTNPGLVLAIAGPALDAFCVAAVEALSVKPATTMLSRDRPNSWLREVSVGGKPSGDERLKGEARSIVASRGGAWPLACAAGARIGWRPIRNDSFGAFTFVREA